MSTPTLHDAHYEAFLEEMYEQRQDSMYEVSHHV